MARCCHLLTLRKLDFQNHTPAALLDFPQPVCMLAIIFCILRSVALVSFRHTYRGWKMQVEKPGRKYTNIYSKHKHTYTGLSNNFPYYTHNRTPRDARTCQPQILVQFQSSKKQESLNWLLRNKIYQKKFLIIPQVMNINFKTIT